MIDLGKTDTVNDAVFCQLKDRFDGVTPLEDEDGKVGFWMYGYYSKKGKAERRSMQARHKNRTDDPSPEERERLECELLARVIDRPENVYRHGVILTDEIILMRDFFIEREEIKKYLDEFWADEKHFLAI